MGEGLEGLRLVWTGCIATEPLVLEIKCEVLVGSSHLPDWICRIPCRVGFAN